MQWAEKRTRPAAPNYPLTTGLLVWCGLVVVSSLYITLPMVSVFAGAFHASPDMAAWTSSAFSLAYGAGGLLFGPVSERYGRKHTILWGLAALAFITVLMGFAANLPELIAFRAVQGLAAATFAPSALAYIGETYPAEKRVTTVGFVSTGFLVAGIAGQLFSSVVNGLLTWSYVFYFLGALYLLSAVLVGAFVPKGEPRRSPATVLAFFKQMGTVSFQRSLSVCYLIAVTLLFSFVGMYAVLGTYLSHAPFALNANQIFAVRALGAIGMICSPFAGRLVAKYGMEEMLRAGLALAAAGLAAVGMSSSLAVSIVMSVVFVAGISLTVPTLISMVGSIAGDARGAAITLYMFVLFVGATLGPIVALALLKTGSYMLTYEALAAVLALAFAATFFVPDRKRKEASR
ncbi:MFS transporter [Gordoniibacillus kamchatkensis]|uniref:MFS transporter n=2 Tax=Gordoniibacillus kamchatkensis TaxID=1590651 RepID=A0ABR5ALP5_9BACL|nr:MFS transporter [Paenibacillus sp. VKM B-2647]